MIVTNLEEGYRKLTKVYVDEEYVFSLYQNELKRYKISVGEELTEGAFQTILEETVLRRGKMKALNLLQRMDYTEGEIRSRLRQQGYTDSIIDRVIAYINSYHYLNDERYTVNYINTKKSTKSIRQLKMELKKKGVDDEIIARQMEKIDLSDEEALKKAIQKKVKDTSVLTYEEKQKVAQGLFRKGFSERDIRRHLHF